MLQREIDLQKRRKDVMNLSRAEYENSRLEHSALDDMQDEIEARVEEVKAHSRKLLSDTVDSNAFMIRKHTEQMQALEEEL